MRGTLPGRVLLSLLLAGPLLGCVARPPEKFIVLRPLPSERRTVSRPPARRTPIPAPDLAAEPGTQAVVATPLDGPQRNDFQLNASKPTSPEPVAARVPGRPAEPMSRADKESLFRDFERYLDRTGHPQ